MSHIDISYRQCPQERERFSTPLAKRSRRKTAKRAKKKKKNGVVRYHAFLLRRQTIGTVLRRRQCAVVHAAAQTWRRGLSSSILGNCMPSPTTPVPQLKEKNKNAGRHHRVRRSLASQMYKLLPITDGHSSVTSHTTYDVQEG